MTQSVPWLWKQPGTSWSRTRGTDLMPLLDLYIRAASGADTQASPVADDGSVSARAVGLHSHLEEKS